MARILVLALVVLVVGLTEVEAIPTVRADPTNLARVVHDRRLTDADAHAYPSMLEARSEGSERP